MSANVGAKEIVTDRLVLHLDAANYKSYTFGENLLLRSQQISSWSNNGNAFLLTGNAETAPDGTLTATTLEQSAATGASRWASSLGNFKYISGSVYTLSGYLKKVSGTDAQPTIYLWINGIGQQSVGTLTTNWTRYSYTFTSSLTNEITTIFTGINTSFDVNGAANNFKFAAWGFQLERGATANAYIPTTTSPVRNSIFDLGVNNYSGSLSSNSGSNVAGPLYSKENSGVIKFNGLDDRITFPAFPSTNDGISISSFVKFDDLSSQRTVIGKNDVLFSFAANQIFWWPDVTNTNIQVTPTLSTNTWYHVGVTQTGSICNVFLNGQNIYNNTNTSQFKTTFSQYTSVGAYSSTQRFFSGSIAIVSVYHKVLSNQEMLQNYNALKTRFGLS
jgi:hypothetical protein